jgi:RNA polymerase sigma-70 factor (ECF subfamily)
MKIPSPQHDEDLIHTRRTLLERLKDRDDTPSWREFFEIYWRLIYSVARKYGLSDFEAQEVVQETIISVSRNIDKFQCDAKRGSFKSWLLTMSRWRILDQVRQRDQHLKDFNRDSERGASERHTDTIDRIPDPNDNGMNAVWEEEWRSNLASLAMERVRKRVDPMHYQIFHLNAVKDFPVAKICEMFGVPANRVYVIKSRISALIRKEVRALESIPDHQPLPSHDEEGKPTSVQNKITTTRTITPS